MIHIPDNIHACLKMCSGGAFLFDGEYVASTNRRTLFLYRHEGTPIPYTITDDDVHGTVMDMGGGLIIHDTGAAVIKDQEFPNWRKLYRERLWTPQRDTSITREIVTLWSEMDERLGRGTAWVTGGIMIVTFEDARAQFVTTCATREAREAWNV